MEYENFLKLGASIAHHMRGAWRVDRRAVSPEHQHQGVKMIGDHGKVISLYQSYQTKGKVAVRGLCPDYGLTWQQKRSACLPHGSDTIQVSPSRKPRHIAADIERRLMPSYEEVLEKAEGTAQKYKRNMAILAHIEHALRCVSPDLRGYNNNAGNTQRRIERCSYSYMMTSQSLVKKHPN